MHIHAANHHPQGVRKTTEQALVWDFSASGIREPEGGAWIGLHEVNPRARCGVRAWLNEMAAKEHGHMTVRGRKTVVNNVKTAIYSVYRSATDHTVVGYLAGAYFDTAWRSTMHPQQLRLFNLEGKAIKSWSEGINS